ncbi:hypothetical protein K474DRAFT_1775179 [Panus rudis PR-1116 ss-1]|nr:hypothetical protein K474DRAFT_1775179 [Panus rudis PR-1116 ss-1]
MDCLATPGPQSTAGSRSRSSSDERRSASPSRSVAAAASYHRSASHRPPVATSARGSELEGDGKEEVVERAQSAIEGYGLNYLSPCDILAAFEEPLETSGREAEDESLLRACRGYYSQIGDEDWNALIFPLLETFDTWPMMNATSSRTDAIEDLHERLVQRHVRLEDAQLARSGTDMVYQWLRQIDQLKFAADWNTLQGVGANTAKTEFYQALFLRLPDTTARIVGRTPEEVKMMLGGQLKEKYRHYRRKQERGITERKRLFAAYNLFGSAVFLDPFWRAENMGGRRTGAFMDVLRRIKEDIPETMSLASQEVDTLYHLHENATHIAYTLFRLLGGPEVHHRLVDLLEEYPPDVCS